MRAYACGDQVWFVESRGYERHNGMPCRVLDLHGDIETFVSPDTVVHDSVPLGNGWVRYWLVSTDPALRTATAEIVSVNERAASR